MESKMLHNYTVEELLEPAEVSKRKSKIIWTLGPAWSTLEMLIGMLESGMNIARLNFSHGDHKTHGTMVEKLREAKKLRPGNQCAILLDTKGPEIRTGFLVDHKPVSLTKGQNLKIVTDYTIEGDETRISCSYQDLPNTVKPGDEILVADGKLICRVKEWYEDFVDVEVLNDATIGEK